MVASPFQDARGADFLPKSRVQILTPRTLGYKLLLREATGMCQLSAGPWSKLRADRPGTESSGCHKIRMFTSHRLIALSSV